MAGSNEDLVVRVVVDTGDSGSRVENLENVIVSALRKSASEAKKLAAEEAAAVRSAEREKEAARLAGMSSWQRGLESGVGSLSKLARTLNEVNTPAGDFVKTLASTGEKMLAVSKGGIAGYAAAASLLGNSVGVVAQKVYQMTSEFAQNAVEANRAAVGIGSTVSAYSSLSAGIELGGGSADSLRMALTQLDQRMVASLTTVGSMTGPLAKFGVELIDSSGHVRTSTEMLALYADEFAKIPPGPLRSVAALQAFGEAGTQILPVLSEGSMKLRAQAGYVSALGASFSELDATTGKALVAAQSRVMTFATAASNALARAAAPTVTAGLNAIGNIAESVFLSMADNVTRADVALAKFQADLSIAKFADVKKSTAKLFDDLDGLASEFNKLERAAKGMTEADRIAWAVMDDGMQVTGGLTMEVERLKQSNEAETKSRVDAIQSKMRELETIRATISASGNLTAAQAEVLKQVTGEIGLRQQQLDKLVATNGVVRQYIATRQAEVGISQKALEATNLEAKATELAKSVSQNLFMERARLMALEKTASEDLALAKVKADQSVIESARKLAAARATIEQQVEAGINAAGKSVVDAEVKYNVTRRTGAEALARAIIAADEGVLLSQQALDAARATSAQTLAKARKDAEASVFKAEQEHSAYRATMPQQIQLAERKAFEDIDKAHQQYIEESVLREARASKAKIDANTAVEKARTESYIVAITKEESVAKAVIEARTGVYRAEVALEVQRRTMNEQIANDRIILEGRILSAQTQRIGDIKNLDMIAASAVADKDRDIDGMRNQFYINDVTRTQALHAARWASLLELQAKEIGNDALRQMLSDKELIRKQVHADVDAQILAQIYQQERAKYAVGAAQEVLNGLARRGFDVSALTAEACGQIAGGIGMASSASVSFTSNMQTAASAAQDIMRSAAAAAQSYARGLGGIQSGAAAGVGGGRTVTIGSTTLAVPGSSGAAVLSGYEAMYASQAFQAAQTQALALEEAKKRNADHAALVERLKTPAQRAAEEQAKQLEDKRRQLAALPRQADFNRQMAELDLQLRNAQTAQSNQFAPGLAGLKNQADLLAQQSALLDTRRQVGNLPALSAGQNALDLLAQQRSIADSRRQLANLPAMSAGMTTLELLSQQSSIFNARRTLDSFDQMASGQNTLDLLSQQTNIKNAERALSSFDAMSRGQNTLDLLSQQTNIKNTSRTISAFDQMASSQNVLDLMSQATSIKNAQRTLANFDAMAAGANVLDLLSQETSIANVARTLSNFSAMASGANTLDILNQYGQNLTSQRQIANYGAMTPLLNNADILKAQTSALEIERGAVSDKRMVDWSLFGGGGRPIPQSNGLESLRTSTDPRMIALAQRMGIQRFATGTGLAGVQGAGSGDTQPALLTPGEVVLNPAESDVLRALAKGAGIDYERMAALFAKAVATELAGMSVKAEGREIGKLMLKQSRNGQRTTYAPAGLTKAR